MRWALLLVSAGCGFSEGTAPADAAIDGSPDVLDVLQITWSVDQTSQKACPSDTTQWTDFITAHGLGISAPSSIWLMQDASGSLADVSNIVPLTPSGTAAYQRTVSGWSRLAVAMTDGTGAVFANTSSPGLANVSTASMTILMYYATEKPPGVIRSVLFGGSGVSSSLGQVDIDASDHFKLTVNTSSATGTIDHGTSVVPVVLKLDRTHGEQHLIVEREVIAPAYSALGSSKGILLGAANHAAPEGRWLYMAAWFGSGAEMTDAQIDAMITALGW